VAPARPVSDPPLIAPSTMVAAYVAQLRFVC
jgi:hypothetical protein